MTETVLPSDTTVALSREIERALDLHEQAFTSYDKVALGITDMTPELNAEMFRTTAMRFLLSAAIESPDKMVGEVALNHLWGLLMEAPLRDDERAATNQKLEILRSWSDVAELICSAHSDVRKFIKVGFNGITDDVRELVRTKLLEVLGEDFAVFLR